MTKSERPAYVRTYLLFVGIGDGDYRPPPPPPLATIRLPRQYLISPQRPSDLLLISHYPLAWNFLIPMLIVPIVTSSHTEHRHSLCHLFCLLRIEHHAQYGSQRMRVSSREMGPWRPPTTRNQRRERRYFWIVAQRTLWCRWCLTAAALLLLLLWPMAVYMAGNYVRKAKIWINLFAVSKLWHTSGYTSTNEWLTG